MKIGIIKKVRRESMEKATTIFTGSKRYKQEKTINIRSCSRIIIEVHFLWVAPFLQFCYYFLFVLAFLNRSGRMWSIQDCNAVGGTTFWHYLLIMSTWVIQSHRKAIPKFLKETHVYVYSKTCIRMLTVALLIIEMTGVQIKRIMDK